MASCGQCGKPAIGEVGGVPLCVDCWGKFVDAWHKVETTRLTQQQQRAAMINYLSAEMAAIVGVPDLHRQLVMPGPPPPVQQASPVTFNNINVDRSIVGSLNTGEVRRIDVNLSQLHNLGNDTALSALKTLTEAVIAEAAFNDAAKNEMIEQIAFLSAQAVAPSHERKPGVIKATLSAVGTAAAAVPSIVAAWQAAEPVLKSLFGMQ